MCYKFHFSILWNFESSTLNSKQELVIFSAACFHAFSCGLRNFAKVTPELDGGLSNLSETEPITQKQSPRGVLKNTYSEKFFKIHRKTLLSKSHF